MLTETSNSFINFAKNPFTYRERCRREKVKAIIASQKASPTLRFGSVVIVNPVYDGPSPYRGPEVFDPKNAGNRFIPVRS